MSARAWIGWGGVGVAGLVLAMGVIGAATATPSAPDATVATSTTTPATAVAEPAPTASAARPTATARPTDAAPPVAQDTALAAVAKLPVKGRAPKTGYSRQQFGQAWFDADRNGCDTRNDILRRDLVDRQMKNWCKVLAGTRSPDPYTGRTIRFVIGGPSEIDVDHVVVPVRRLAEGCRDLATRHPPDVRQRPARPASRRRPHQPIQG